MILPTLLALLAGCDRLGGGPAASTVARPFQLVYLANLSGEIEPCG
jgi:hypothetical protein